MHRPLGRAALVVYAPFSLAVARLHSTLAWPLAYLSAWAGGQAGWVASLSIRLLRIWRILGGGKMRQIPLRPQPRKNLFINKESFFNVGGGKIFKRWFLERYLSRQGFRARIFLYKLFLALFRYCQ